MSTKKGQTAAPAADDSSLEWDYESNAGDLYKWENPGQKETGILVSHREVQTNLGPGNRYEMQTKNGTITFFGTSSLHDELKKLPADGSMIVEIELTETKKSRFPNPFKVFKVRATRKTDAKIAALGITVFGDESSEEAA